MFRITLIVLLFIAFPFFINAQCAFTIEPLNSAGCMESHSEAVFTDLTRTTATGNTVEKTTGNNNWNGGAFSTASVRNNGYAETRITQTNKSRIFGLSSSNNPNKNKINSVEYAIILRNWGAAEIQESGSYRANLGNYSDGDQFKIAVLDGKVYYYKNNIVLYESNVIPSLPLFVDLTFQHKNGVIADVHIVNTSSATIRAFSDQSPASISSFKWYQNNILLTETGPELTLNSFSDNDVIRCTAIPSWGACSGIELISNKMVLNITEGMSDSDLGISAVPADQGCYLAQEDVLWNANTPGNIEIQDGNVKKLQGYNTSNGGVYSQNSVGNNGFLEFQTEETNTRKMMGLSSHDGGQSESTIQFAFYMESSTLIVYESGAWKGAYGQFTTNDKMRINVDNGVVKYYKNSDLLYVSDKVPNLPLIADGTMQNMGATLINAKIANPTEGLFTAFTSDVDYSDLDWKLNGQSTEQSGATLNLEDFSENDIITCTYISTQAGCGNTEVVSNSIRIIPNNNISSHSFYIEGITQANGIGVAEEQVVWNPESMANVSNINNNLTKVQGYNQYNAGASSLNTVKNNGYFDFKVSETNKTKAIGLSTNDPNYNYNSTDYAMVLGTNKRFTIYEKGAWKLGNQAYANGDILRIAVENNKVKYYRNGNLVYTSTKTPSLPLLVDVSLSSEGGTVENAVVGNENEGKFRAHLAGLGTSPTLQWYVNGIPAGANQTTFHYPNIENEDIVSCTVTPDFSGCDSQAATTSNRIRFLGPPTVTDWIGGVSTAWNSPANWSDGVPTEMISARIPGGRPHQPVVSSPKNVKNVIVELNATLSVNIGGSLLVHGDFLINGTFLPGNGGIAFNGSGNRKIKGNQLVFNNLIINLSNPENIIDLLSDVSISKEIIFISGKLRGNDQEVVYLHGSESRLGNSKSFIDGRVRKIGNSDFHFPIGSGNIFAPVEISAPQNSTDAFTAQYFNADPNDAGYGTDSQDGSLGRISSCEYWAIDRAKGHSKVSVSLSYENERSCGINDPSFLQVTHWSGSEWENKGMASFDGDAMSGIITSEFPVDDFSPFTIGSLSGINPLPIELFSFTAEKQDKTTNLKWITDSEFNNSHFTLERSNDAIAFREIGRVNGAGASKEKLEYQYLDYTPMAGINYYRLSQTDFDGQQTYFDIRSVYFEPHGEIIIYPNPNKGIFKVVRVDNHPVHLHLIDASGKTQWVKDTDDTLIPVDIHHIPNGIYFLSIDDGRNQIIKKVIIQ